MLPLYPVAITCPLLLTQKVVFKLELPYLTSIALLKWYVCGFDALLPLNTSIVNRELVLIVDGDTPILNVPSLDKDCAPF